MPIVISAEHEYRVWVKVILPKNFSFGPFEGDLNSLIQRVQGLEQSPSKFEALYWRDAVAEHDTSQGDVSWMQRVNPARCREEQNMEASRTEHDQIMFRSTREITAGEELRVWLDQSLEEENGIKRCEEDEFEVRQAICKNCQESFRYTRALAVHVAFGCRGKASRTINCSAHDNEVPSNCDKSLEAGKAVEHFEVTVSSTGWDTTENEDEVMRATLKFPRFGFPESTGSRINKHSPAVLGNSQVLSDPKLAWLISSFPRPRFRKFTTSNGPESLAEYHKQEFRRKFRGNEHYLRRHLYRQNIQKMVSSGNYRRTVTRKEVSQCSLQSFQEFQDIKQEKDEFSNSSGEDCSSTHLSSILVNSACGTGIADPPRCNFPIENLPLGGSLNINTSFLNASKEPVVTRGHSTANVPETHKECPLHADHGQCACKLFADKLSPREMLRSEKNVDMADGMVKSGKEERILHIAPKSQISSVESQSSFTRLGSHYAYHDTQQEVLSYQHLQYQCCSTRSVCVPNNNPLRYHEPAFFVTPMYHYSNLPRIFPYFAHQTAHSSQGSMRTQGFKCNYCGKVYCRKYVLKIHMRTHTGFKPLRCKVCDKSFSDPSNMKKHVKLHESEDTIHKCRYCGRNFVRYRGLLNHIKSKHSGHISISNTM